MRKELWPLGRRAAGLSFLLLGKAMKLVNYRWNGQEHIGLVVADKLYSLIKMNRLSLVLKGLDNSLIRGGGR